MVASSLAETSALTHLLSLYAKKCCMGGGWTVELSGEWNGVGG